MNRNSVSGAYIYTSLEPCGVRNSKSTSCAGLLIEAGIACVYFIAREPTLFQRQCGLQLLTKAGVVCFQLPGLITSSVTQTITCSKRSTLPIEFIS
jgi:pyrimidine deaminase RibD-like protein